MGPGSVGGLIFAHMCKIPARVLEHFGLDPSVPQQQLKEGIMCDTWIAGDLVIQNVSKQSYEHHLAVLERTAELRMSGRLTGLVFLLETLHDPDGSWWRAAPRLPGANAMACGRDRLEVAEEIAREVGEELRTLATLPMGGLPAPSQNQDLDVEEIVVEVARRGRPDLVGLIEAIPPEPPTSKVLAHGDPIHKNILLTESGPVLIDWEFCQPLPAGNDVAHFLAGVVYTLHVATGHERLLAVARDMALGAGLTLGDDELAALIAWGVAREIAIGGSRRFMEALPEICRAYDLG